MVFPKCQIQQKNTDNKNLNIVSEFFPEKELRHHSSAFESKKSKRLIYLRAPYIVRDIPGIKNFFVFLKHCP
jgi:hypothetical protein